MSLWVAIVTFGNLKYTRLCIDSLLANTGEPFQLVVVVGKPGDDETHQYLDGEVDCHILRHETNRGFPASINDIYDYVYAADPQADILFVGNDTICYPKAIDRIMHVARTTDYDYISGKEVPVRSFLSRYPQYKDRFDAGYRLQGDSFAAWRAHARDVRAADNLPIRHHPLTFINGFHNFGLVRRSFFDKVGYVDAAFFPAYFEDNDYVRRGFLAGAKFGEVPEAYYFHFWSRTIYEAQPSAINDRYFPLNAQYYQDKWGGQPGGNEFHDVPFAGAGYAMGPYVIDQEYYADNCRGRSVEPILISYWKWTPRKFRNRHSGQRCIIACNGPSLNDIDTSALTGEVVFALNRGYLKKDLPITYLVCVNGTVLEQFGEEIVDVQTEATFITPVDSLYRHHTYGLRYRGDSAFFGDADRLIYQGHTVTFAALELAYYMGFTDVALIGCDHYFPRAEGKPTNKLVVSDSADIDHFDPDYFGPGVKWEHPNLLRSEEAFQMAKEAYEAVGRRIVNCSTQTRLEVFPRMSLEDWL